MPPRSKRTREVDLGFLQQGTGETDLANLFAKGVAENRPVTEIPVEQLRDNPYQPRTTSDPAGIEELAAVIRKHGFQGALVARPDPANHRAYQLAFGHRRRAAASMAGLRTLPVVVSELSDQQMVELAIAENVQREDLTALEEGKTFELMVNVLGYTHEQVAGAIGKTRGYVRNRLRVAAAPPDIQQLVAAKPDSLRAVDTLIKVVDESLRAEAIQQLLAGRLTTDDLPGFLDAGGVAGLARAAADEQTAQHKPVRRNGALAGAANANETEQRALPRIGNSQLQSALRSLSRFRDNASERDDVTNREFIALLDLRNMAEELYERFSPKHPVEQ